MGIHPRRRDVARVPEGRKQVKGTATKIEMCGTIIRLGDEMEVEYKSYEARIKGRVIELWSPEVSNGHLQARLSCGWCFHDYDRIIFHAPKGDTK